MEISASRSRISGDVEEFADDLVRLRIGFVNVFFVPTRDVAPSAWVLVDGGLRFGAPGILRIARERYGDVPPSAVILTHGHFDHVGALPPLLRRWNVPVYSHRLELPFLTGRTKYPPPDPTVGGGLMARLSPLFPRTAVDVREHIRALPDNGTIPFMPGWRWLATPGHSPGHVSLFRDGDRALIAGDAVTTTRQESALSVLTQHPELNGPPAYFTIDWEQAEHSARALAALGPEYLATGHGVCLSGEAMREALDRLAFNFRELAVPRRGRYVRQPARVDPDGVLVVPPPVTAFRVGRVAAGALMVAGGVLLANRLRRDA